jgi:hypothetical protein
MAGVPRFPPYNFRFRVEPLPEPARIGDRAVNKTVDARRARCGPANHPNDKWISIDEIVIAVTGRDIPTSP